MFSKKKNKTKIQPADDSTEDVPDELEVKESCMKKCCRSIVTPRHCARRICEGKIFFSMFPLIGGTHIHSISFVLLVCRCQGSNGSLCQGSGVD